MRAKGAFIIIGVLLVLVQTARISNKTAFRNTDLLQADAAIMAGTLIFLTVSFFFFIIINYYLITTCLLSNYYYY